MQVSHENVIGFPTSLTLQWTAYNILVYFGKSLHWFNGSSKWDFKMEIYDSHKILFYT